MSTLEAVTYLTNSGHAHTMTLDATDSKDLFEDHFPPGCRQRLLLMLRAYIDASTALRDPVLSVAGFVAPADKWKVVNSKWRDGRRRAGLDVFRMAEFMATPPVGPYRDMPPKKKQATITRLIDLITGTASFGVAAAFRLADFTALPDDDREMCGNNPWALCVMHLIGGVVKVLDDRRSKERVAYFFDAGDEGQPQFIAAMTGVIKRFSTFSEGLHILSVTAVDKRDVPAVDTADFLAWQTAQHVQWMEEDRPVEPRTYLRRVTERVHVESRWYRGQELAGGVPNPTHKQRKLLALLFGVNL